MRKGRILPLKICCPIQFVYIYIYFYLFIYSFIYIFRVLQGTREIWFSIRDGVRSDGSKHPSYGFARFENLPEAGVQLTGSANSEYEDDEGPSSSGGRFENPLYRSKREAKMEAKIEDLKIIDFSSPVSLAVLKNTIQDDDLEEVEMAIEEISETEQ